MNAARANSGSNRVTYRENCWVRSGFLFPRFRSIRITLILPRVLLFLIAFSLRALGPQPFLFELAIIKARRRKGNIEVSSSQIIWP